MYSMHVVREGCGLLLWTSLLCNNNSPSDPCRSNHHHHHHHSEGTSGLCGEYCGNSIDMIHFCIWIVMCIYLRKLVLKVDGGLHGRCYLFQEHGMAQESKKGSTVMFYPLHPQRPSAWQALRYKDPSPIRASLSYPLYFLTFWGRRDLVNLPRCKTSSLFPLGDRAKCHSPKTESKHNSINYLILCEGREQAVLEDPSSRPRFSLKDCCISKSGPGVCIQTYL